MQGISSTMAIASAKVTGEDIITRCLIHLVGFANRQVRPQMSLHLCRSSLRGICQSASSTSGVPCIYAGHLVCNSVSARSNPGASWRHPLLKLKQGQIAFGYWNQIWPLRSP